MQQAIKILDLALRVTEYNRKVKEEPYEGYYAECDVRIAELTKALEVLNANIAHDVQG
jgi:hypothetical protein